MDKRGSDVPYDKIGKSVGKANRKEKTKRPEPFTAGQNVFTRKDVSIFRKR